MAVFNNYIESLDSCDLPSMPVNHIANIRFIENFLTKSEIAIDYLEKECEVFNCHYLYIFYGKAAFRLNQADAYPMCFVFKKPSVCPVKAFPFDSGAFFHNRMDKYFNKDLTLADFDFTGNNEYIYRIVKNFFGDNSDYYDEKHKTGVLAEDIPAIKGYLEMLADDKNDNLDGRKSAIELIYDCSLSLNEGLELVVLPEFDFNFKTGEISCDDLKKTLELNYKCEVKSYSNRITSPIDSSYKDIKRIVRTHIKNNGGL